MRLIERRPNQFLQSLKRTSSARDPEGLSGIMLVITCLFIVFAIGRRIQVARATR